jgi:hypothetical protein
VQGVRYSESEVETDVTALQLETYVADLELEMDRTTLEFLIDVAGLELETYPDALDLEMKTDMP